MFKKCVVSFLLILMISCVAMADTSQSQTVKVTVNVLSYLEISSNLAPSQNNKMVRMSEISPVIINAMPNVESSGTTNFNITSNIPSFVGISNIVQPQGMSGLTATVSADKVAAGTTNIILTASIVVPREQPAGVSEGEITITATAGY